jgi:uncharacterized protein YndB with AHSA1/START domain
MPRATAERELLAPREDVWAFLAEPRHLSDWWPGVAAVEPDRRGLRAGARWQVRRGARPGLFRGAGTDSVVVVQEVDEPRRIAWQVVAERLDIEVELRVAELDRTLVRLTVSGPLVLAFRRSLPRAALERLYDLVQTAARL